MLRLLSSSQCSFSLLCVLSFASACGASADADVGHSEADITDADASEAAQSAPSTTSDSGATESDWKPLFDSLDQCPSYGDLEVRFDRTFPASVDGIFPYLSHEDHIGWLGPFHMKAFGDAAPYGVGSVRVVGLNSAPMIEEGVFGYAEPADADGIRTAAVTYGVLSSSMYKDHCGVMRLTETDSGTRMQWLIRFNVKKGFTQWFGKSFTQSYLGPAFNRLEKRLTKDKVQ